MNSGNVLRSPRGFGSSAIDVRVKTDQEMALIEERQKVISQEINNKSNYSQALQIVKCIDKFIKDHLNQQPIKKNDVKSFFLDIISRLGIHSLDKQKFFENLNDESLTRTQPNNESAFKERLDNTMILLKHNNLDLSFFDRLCYKVYRLCEDLGAKHIAQSLRNKIDSNKLNLLEDIEYALANGIEKMLNPNIRGVEDNLTAKGSGQIQAIGKFTTMIINERHNVRESGFARF